MSGKLLGALLILLGGFLACFYQRRAVQMEISLLRELTAALESMETAIRWQKKPLPRTIMQQCDRPLCGEIFENVLKSMESGNALQTSWEQGFSEKTSPDIAEILCQAGSRSRQEKSVSEGNRL